MAQRGHTHPRGSHKSSDKSKLLLSIGGPQQFDSRMSPTYKMDTTLVNTRGAELISLAHFTDGSDLTRGASPLQSEV